MPWMGTRSRFIGNVHCYPGHSNFNDSCCKDFGKTGPHFTTKTALIGTIFLVLGLAIAGLAVGGIYDEMYPNPATTTLYVRDHPV